MIYIWVTVFTLILAHFITGESESGDISKKRLTIGSFKIKNQWLQVLAFLPLFIVSAIRYRVGSDYWWVYYLGYKRVGVGIDSDNFEIGYKLLVKLLNSITEEPQILFVVTSLLFCGFTFKAIYQDSKGVALSIIFLMISRYYFISMNVVRQGVGMAIVLYALKYLYKEKSNIKFVFWVLVATSIHLSMIICLVFLGIEKLDFSRKRFIAAIGIMIGTLILNQYGILTQIISLLVGNTKYLRHLSSFTHFVGDKFFWGTLVLNLLVLWVYYDAGKQADITTQYKIYFNAQIIVFFICTFMNIIPLMERLYWIFGFVQILSFPYMISLLKNKYKKYLYMCTVCAIFLGYCVYDIGILHDHGVLPYQTIWGVK